MSFFANNDNNKNVEEKESSSFFSLFSKEKDKDYYDQRKDDIDNLRAYHDSLKKDDELLVDKSKLSGINTDDHPLPENVSNLRKKVNNEKEDDNFQVKEKYKSSGVLGTNLIKNEVAIYVDWKKNITTIVAFVFVFVVILSSSLYVVRVQEKKIEANGERLDQELANLNQQLVTNKNDIKEADLFRRKIGIAKYYLKNHIYWTKFFQYVEDYTLSNVSFGDVFSYSGGLERSFIFSAKTDSYADIVNQLRVLRKSEYVISAESDSGSALIVDLESSNAKSVISFDVNFSVDGDIFYKSDNEFLEDESEQ